MRGSGKTSLLYELVAHSRRLLVADPTGSWHPEQRGYPIDYEVVIGAAALRAKLLQLGATNPANPFRLVYRDHRDPIRIMAPGAALALGHCTLVLEELKYFCSPSAVPYHLQNLLSFGREPEVNLVGTTRRAQEVNDMLFGEADLVYLFHTQRGLGLERIRQNVPSELVDRLPTLKRFQHLTYLGGMGLTEKGVRARFGREGA